MSAPPPLGADVFVGIDAGTTGCKAALFDAAGHMLGLGYSAYPCLHPHPGWVEQDMALVWQGIRAASRAARAGANVADVAIRSIALSSQRGSFVLLDGHEQPLGPAILWNDGRAQEVMPELEQRVSAQRYRDITGMPLSASWSASKLAWLLRHRPELIGRAAHICNGQEYFMRRMGADALQSDPSSLTLNGMLDIRTLDWSAELCAAIGLDPALLPPVGAPGAPVGRLGAHAADELGLPAGIVLCRGGGDQQCAAIGAGVIRQGLAEVTLGTSAMMVAHLDDPALVTGHAAYIGGHAMAGKWDAEGGAFATGSCLTWWADQFGATENAAQQGGNRYERLVQAARTVPAGSQGAVFHPFFAGQITPSYDSTARGAFLGLTHSHDHACMTRALMEGCASEVRMMVDGIAADLAGGIEELRITGGGARSRFSLQLHADILRRPVTPLRNPECGVLGAAILGAVGSGYFGDIAEAVGAMVRTATAVEPDPRTRAVYDEGYAIFRLAHDALRDAQVGARICAYQRKHF